MAQHTPAFVDPRYVHPAVWPAQYGARMHAAAEAYLNAQTRCPCGATGAHTLCPLQPLTPELRNAAL